MGAPLLFADNILSVTEYPYLGWNGSVGAGLVDQTGGPGPAGFEAFRVADTRRSPFDAWQGAVHADSFILAACYGLPAGAAAPQLVPRTASCLVLDRGHNLSGFPVAVYASQDNFVSQQTVFSGTIPYATGSRPSDPFGCVTEEGAWILTFTPTAAAYWKFDIPDMGVNLSPTIVGLQLGLAYQPVALYRPFPEHQTALIAAESRSVVGWRSLGTRGFVQQATLELRADNEFDFEQARFTVAELFGQGRPMWIIQDQDRGSEAWCGVRATTPQGFVRPQNWYFPLGSFSVEEHEAAPIK